MGRSLQGWPLSQAECKAGSSMRTFKGRFQAEKREKVNAGQAWWLEKTEAGEVAGEP